MFQPFEAESRRHRLAAFFMAIAAGCALGAALPGETGVRFPPYKLKVPEPRDEVLLTATGRDWGPRGGNRSSKPMLAGQFAPAPVLEPSSAESRSNRLWYVGIQTMLSTYIYGLSIPVAYGVESPRVYAAMPLIVAPIAFGSHFFFAKNRPFGDSHLLGTTYLSLASLYAANALPFVFLPDDAPRFKTASFASLALYPLGVWGGYQLGEYYSGRPGRIRMQMQFALGFGLLGAFSPLLYFERPFSDKNEDLTRRLMLGQSLAMTTAGHFLADYYRQGENIPAGVSWGILHHTVLGTLLGLEVAALADAESWRPWVGAALAGGTLGFAEGLFWYRDKYDSQERAIYNTLGTIGGALMGSGVIILVQDEDRSGYEEKVLNTSLLVGGTWLGYLVTNLLTRGMVETGAAQSPSGIIRRLTLNPIPLPEPVSRDGKLSMRYRFPGLTVRLR